MTTSIITTTTFTIATGWDIRPQAASPVVLPSAPTAPPVPQTAPANTAVDDDIPACVLAAYPRCAWAARKRCNHTASHKS